MSQTSLISISSLDEEVGFPVLFKREDESFVYSHKFRPIQYQLKIAKESNYLGVVISTSGNAGIALSKIAPSFGIAAYIFVDHRVDAAKLSHMGGQNVFVIASSHAMRLSNYLAAKYHFKNLRPSKDDDAIIGYESLGAEIIAQVKSSREVSAVFTYCTSGASLLGMHRYFTQQGFAIPVHAVQSGAINSVTRYYDEVSLETESVAGFLGVKQTRRVSSVQDALQETDARGWYVSESAIQTACALLEKHGIETSFEGAASFAALQRAYREGGLVADVHHVPVCILSGAKLERQSDLPTVYVAETFEDIDLFMNTHKEQ